MRRRSNGDVLGLTLTPGSVVAASAPTQAPWERAIEMNGGGNGTRDALGAVFADAARASNLAAPMLAIALMPPLAETRTVSLPPLKEEERNRFLARNAGRYFVGARGPQVIGSTAPVAWPKGGPAGAILVTSASQQLVQAVHAASAAAGCQVQAVVPAESAWAAAAVTVWPACARGDAHLVVAHDGRVDLLTLANGALVSVRRFRGADDAPAIVAAAGHAGQVAVIGTPAPASAIAEALAAAGARVLRGDPKWAALTERPDALAARFAGAAQGPEIRSDETRERDLAAVRRAAWTLFGIAAAVLVAAGIVHYRGAYRELASVKAARQTIRPQVDASLVGRSSVDAAYRQVAALASAARRAPRWSVVLADLATQLSDNASLTSFRARGDSIFIDGVAAQAAPVFDDIARVSGVTGVRATQPVRREAVEGGDALEHFSVGARIVGGRR